MKKNKDTFYSYLDVTGKEDLDDRVFSQKEVDTIADLFSEFYFLNSENFMDEEEAYSEFIDVYSSLPKVVDVEETPEPRPTKPKDPRLVRGAITVAGSGLGYASAKIMNRKDSKLKAEITEKVKAGLANKQDIAMLGKVSKRMRNRAIAGTVTGGALAYGGTILANKYSTTKSKGKKFSDTSIINKSARLSGKFSLDREFSTIKNSRSSRDRDYSSFDVNQLIDDFSDFYSDHEDLFEDDMEMAYSSFLDSKDSEYNFFAKIASGGAKMASSVGKD